MQVDETPIASGSAPFLEAIFIADAAGTPMRRIPEVEAIVGRGLRGDRYAEGYGYYSKVDPCEVTLIEGEILDLISARWNLAIYQGQHRRNLVVRGLRLGELSAARFRIGSTLLEYDRPRPPCAHVERLTEKGMTRALGEGAGIAARIVERGSLREGDLISIFPGAGKRIRKLP